MTKQFRLPWQFGCWTARYPAGHGTGLFWCAVVRGAHVGNYFGAFRQWVADQYLADSVFCVVDLHALTIQQDPDRCAADPRDGRMALRGRPRPRDLHRVRPEPRGRAHGFSWLLECTATFGELRRMTQFKEKSKGNESVSVGFFTYPVLQAADILLYDANKVPIGDDQRQHLELARDIAMRFNGRYGETFVIPAAVVPKVAARVMDLQHPERKMSKSVSSPLGTIDLAGRRRCHPAKDPQGRDRQRRRGALRPGAKARALQPDRALRGGLGS